MQQPTEKPLKDYVHYLHYQHYLLLMLPMLPTLPALPVTYVTYVTNITSITYVTVITYVASIIPTYNHILPYFFLHATEPHYVFIYSGILIWRSNIPKLYLILRESSNKQTTSWASFMKHKDKTNWRVTIKDIIVRWSCISNICHWVIDIF